jgi:hypothetical protein
VINVFGDGPFFGWLEEKPFVGNLQAGISELDED